MTSNSIIPAERVERRILSIRSQVLNQAVKRNIDRFPRDFMFRLTQKESEGLGRYLDSTSLRSQFVTSNSRRGGRRYRPLAFTEQGVAMLSSVLRSARAVQVNIAIMRAFVKLREILATHQQLARRLDELEGKYDKQFRVVFDAIRELMTPTAKPRHRIGFAARASD